MTAGLTLVVLAAVLITAGFKNKSILDTVLGLDREQDSGRGTFDPLAPGNRGPVLTDKPVGRNAKAIIDSVAIPLARKNGINATAASVAAANRRHSPVTLTGGRSDHSGPPAERWAADLSNGSSPTPQMDALAADIARAFDIPWDGSGAQSVTHNGIRYQLIYRSLVGGNHFNHVHIGVEIVG